MIIVGWKLIILNIMLTQYLNKDIQVEQTYIFVAHGCYVVNQFIQTSSSREALLTDMGNEPVGNMPVSA